MTNSELQHEVELELSWDPLVAHAGIAVTATGHEVTLSGTVTCHAERFAAVRAATRIKGVCTVIDGGLTAGIPYR